VECSFSAHQYSYGNDNFKGTASFNCKVNNHVGFLERLKYMYIVDAERSWKIFRFKFTYVYCKDERDASSVTDEQKALFRGVFESKGMKPVDFMRLMAIAERIDAKRGDKIVSIDKVRPPVCSNDSTA
jgi:hypothetical protein